MNKGNWGKVRAFFDLQTEEGFTIKGFKLVEGINGLFVGFPSQKGSDDEYYDTVWADRDVKEEELNNLAINQYNQDSATTLEPPKSEQEQPKEIVEEQPMKGDNLSENTANKEETTSAAAFSDDDIPF